MGVAACGDEEQHRLSPSPIEDMERVDLRSINNLPHRFLSDWSDEDQILRLMIEEEKKRSGGDPYIFSISGQIFHRLGSLIPTEGMPPKFAQMFVFDTANEIKHRMNSFPSDINDISEQIIKELKDMFDEHNVLVKVFRYARDRLNADGVENVKIKLTGNRSSDRREYDLPTIDELAILIVDETGEDTYHPDIVVQHINKIAGVLKLIGCRKVISTICRQCICVGGS
ncbi:hypothetical protein LINPERPRIM_LOCUS10928 [Linum perenne]